MASGINTTASPTQVSDERGTCLVDIPASGWLVSVTGAPSYSMSLLRRCPDAAKARGGVGVDPMWW